MIEDIVYLRTLLTRGGFMTYSKYVAGLTLEDEIRYIYETISRYYEEYPDEQEITFQDLRMYFALNYPAMKDKELVTLLFDQLESLQVNPDLVNKHLANLIERHYTAKIIESLTGVLDGREYGKLPDTIEYIEAFEDSVASLNKETDEFVTTELATLLDTEVRGAGIKWRLSCLNHDIGELRGGSLGHVFARVDTGKTTFLVSEAANFAKQLVGDQVLAWFNNEEKGTKVQLRIYSGLLGLTKEELVTRQGEAEKSFQSQGGNRIKLYDDAIIDITDIEKVLKKYNVRLVIIDQGDKVHFRGDGKYATHERLKLLYGKFRELAKQYDCDIITAGQADYMAEGKKWLNLTNMDNSKTGKPGELDYAIGIGAIFEGPENLRYIHMCKNKMNNGAHGRHEAYMEPAIAQYTD